MSAENDPSEDDATWALYEPTVWESPDARSIPTLLAAIGQLMAAEREIDARQQALAELITRHEAHDGRVPASQLRAVLGMPARDRGDR